MLIVIVAAMTRQRLLGTLDEIVQLKYQVSFVLIQQKGKKP